MSDTWAAVLAISVAVMALVQIVYLVGFAIAAKKLMTVAAVSDRVNAVADDVRAVTAKVQQVATTVTDGVHSVEQQVRSAGQRVQQTVDQVPPAVKKGVPAGLAILAALKTVQQVRRRLKDDRASAHDYYAAS
jgi:Na+/H+-translocating membrane pyrophosphatase